ncbi:MAG TPA: iron-sulfur cluster assembly accessory protein [Bacteroidota bacterium]|nr:iron-sulfur cluster assembly accessory protein [Bacteroidota bacterium]
MTEQANNEITITPEAVEEILRLRKEQNVPDDLGLRIGIESSSCCGVSYILGFDKSRPEIDRILQLEGLTVYIDEQSYQFLAGSILSFAEGPEGTGFYFQNPNDEGCNCGDGEDCCH